MPLDCPNCGSRNLRPARVQNREERLRSFLFVSPLRCKDCRTRFVSRTIFLEDILYARCPECDRMDLNGWTGRTYVPGGWTWLKSYFGAYKWRCEYCRLNFASFRRRKEVFTFSRWKKRNPAAVAEKTVHPAGAEIPRLVPCGVPPVVSQVEAVAPVVTPEPVIAVDADVPVTEPMRADAASAG